MSTLLTASRKGILPLCPLLTRANISKYVTETQATHMEHMQRIRQNLLCPMWVAWVSVTYFDILALVSRGHSGRIPLMAAVNSVLFAQLLNAAWWNCIESFNLFVWYKLAI